MVCDCNLWKAGYFIPGIERQTSRQDEWAVSTFGAEDWRHQSGPALTITQTLSQSVSNREESPNLQIANCLLRTP